MIADCGDSVRLEAFSDSLMVTLQADFNDYSIDSGFTSNSNPDIDTTCGASPDKTPHAWFGPNSSQPRTIRTLDTNMTNASRVCLDLKLALEDGSGSPCEGPDLPDEGVYIQYSTDGGGTWTDIFYFNPDTNCCGCGGGCGGNHPSPFVEWDNYCFSLPSGAKTSNTRIRLYQPSGTGTDYDHWGIDNFQILKSDTPIVYNWGNGITKDQDSIFLPTDTSTINADIIDTVANDTCTASAYVGYKDLSISIDPQSPLKCSNDSLGLSVDGLDEGCDYLLDMKDSYGDGWNGAYITVYKDGDSIGGFSASGSGSVETLKILGEDGISFEYHSGSYDSENSYYFIAPSGDTLFQDGPDPQTGFVYSSNLNCSTPTSYTFDWTPGDGLSDSSSVYAKSGVDTPITYSLTVQDSVHAFCQDSDTVNVDTTTSPSVSLGPDTSFCMDDSLTLGIPSSQGYASVVWDNTVFSDSIVVDSSYGPSPQQHWVTVTDSNGCSDSDSIEATLLDTPVAQLGPDTSLCPDDSVLLDPGSFSAYQWTNGSNDSSIWVAGHDSSWAQGQAVTVTDSAGCTDKDSIVIGGLPEPSVQLPPDTTICASDSLLLSTSAPSPTWDDGSTNSYHEVDSSYAGLGLSLHWVHSINASGCEDRDSILVDISICSKLKEHEKRPSVKIVPNPASEQVRVQAKGPRFKRKLEIELYDTEGRKVLQKEGAKGKQEALLNVSELAPGTYYLKLRSGKASLVEKLIVK